MVGARWSVYEVGKRTWRFIGFRKSWHMSIVSLLWCLRKHDPWLCSAIAPQTPDFGAHNARFGN